MRKLLTAGAIVAVMAGILVSTPGNGAFGAPPTNPAVTDSSYTACNRIFSDPHAYWPAPTQIDPDRSPYAKGAAACAATDFYTYIDMFIGTSPAFPSAMDYLERLFPRFIEFYTLEDDFGDGTNCATAVGTEDLCSAGLPQQGVSDVRERSDMFMVRVTDEESPIPEADKKHFVFPLSIHGIERAGAEAGPRAAEDLATWAYCEARLPGMPNPPNNNLTNCALEAPIPHPLLETRALAPDNLSAGAALREATIYFAFANPDGWRRGDPENLVRFYQRYNGNGVDLNRDWPAVGFTNRPYTPWSEPETRGFGQVLQSIKSKWAGGIDLHGQLIDRAYSFTLMGASERDYAKDQRILQVVKGAWVDAETRLGWHPLIIPNTAPPPTCVPSPVGGNVCDHMYGVQWGTVWDTIAYQVTGAYGDWIDSPIGLDGDGIDNEMTLSHLGNCGIGSCYLIDFEQLHVDGNKSLVYAMVNFTLLPEDQHFEAPGKVGYVFDPTVLSHPGTTDPTPPPGLSPQPNQLNIVLSNANNFTHAFSVLGPDSTPAHYNGGFEGKATPVNVAGLSGSTATSSVVAERQVDDGEPPVGEDAGCGAAGDDWSEVNRYFNQGSTYAQAGQAVHVNAPIPGNWRICVVGPIVAPSSLGSALIDLDLTFSTEKAWPDPGQLPYSVSNMKFFEELAPFMDPGQLVQVNVPDILSGAARLDNFSSLVIADNPAPGLTDPSPELTLYKDKLVNYVKRGGNLVLTDGALQLLGTMGFVAPSAVARNHFYAGFTAFTTNGGSNNTYADPLAFNLDQDGAAEGPNHRHQTYEPVPLGFDIGSRSSCMGEPPAPPAAISNQCTSPHWTVAQSGAGSWGSPLMGVNSRTVGQTNNGRTVLGELSLGCGRVRIAGALLPMPTERYYHPFGLANYALTYSGWQMFKNLVQWNRPRITSRRTSIPCAS
ncbi:MAG TPA: M14 family zinc carboxypeptidase [Actinomycetota bacterium]|nr:M14 family zinc carboxypeptidase [Actinomycetota bacterium]